MSYSSRENQARLPAAVNDLAMRLGARLEHDQSEVALTQSGQMKLRLDAKSWWPSTAGQLIRIGERAFEWRAQFAPFGIVSVRDALACGEGQLDAKALLIPVIRGAVSRADAGRIDALPCGLPLAPEAILLNTSLRWRADSADKLIFSAGAAETAVEVVMSLDGDGRGSGAFAPDRPRSTTAPYLPTPWLGRFSDHRLHLGRWLPCAEEVAWEVNGYEELYWQGQMQSWEMR